MADKNSSKNNFIMQAGILAAAGIISRIIGLLYRGPLQSVIGNLGLGYYQSAYNYYTIILLISSYSIPSAISKAIAQKLGEKEYRNAHRLFHGAMIYVLVVGGIASLFLFFGAGLFVSGAAVTVLRTFAPTIFVYGILGVLRGYFQAHKSMAPTAEQPRSYMLRWAACMTTSYRGPVISGRLWKIFSSSRARAAAVATIMPPAAPLEI